jgi:hypothetical protein
VQNFRQSVLNGHGGKVLCVDISAAMGKIVAGYMDKTVKVSALISLHIITISVDNVLLLFTIDMGSEH